MVGSALRADLAASGRGATASRPFADQRPHLHHLHRVGLALRANLAASREPRSRVGARLRLDLLCKQGRGKATPLPNILKVQA